MSKALIAAFRGRRVGDEFARRFADTATRRLAPDGLVPEPAACIPHGSTLLYVFNPQHSVTFGRAGCCLGLTEGPSERVLDIGGDRPRGTFALFRRGPRSIEVLSDFAGSRSIWFYVNQYVFVAATSQRLMTMLLGSHEPNPKAVKWMLNTGTLGCSDSWDARFVKLAARSRLRLDLKTWTHTVSTERATEAIADLGPGPATERLFDDAVRRAATGLDLRRGGWYLALSGGMDSRLLFHHLKDAPDLRTVTWSAPEGGQDPLGDAQVARTLSESCNVPNDRMVLGPNDEGFASTLERFVAAGEGRVDHLAAYTDGLDMWRAMAASGRSCLRGYDPFGRSPPVSSSFQARRASTLLVSTDLRGFPIPAGFRLEREDVPHHLARAEGEELHAWRDRLWLEYRTPVVTAALDEIKLAYVEVVNPLLSETVLEVVRRLHWRLRLNKRIVKRLVDRQFPGHPLARRISVTPVESIVRWRPVREVMLEVLESQAAVAWVPDETRGQLRDSLRSSLESRHAWRKALTWAWGHTPMPIENITRRQLRFVRLSSARLALRCVLATTVCDLLADDARASSEGSELTRLVAVS